MAKNERRKLGVAAGTGVAATVGLGLGARALAKRFKLQPPVVRKAPAASARPVAAAVKEPSEEALRAARESAYNKWVVSQSESRPGQLVSKAERMAKRQELGLD